MRAIMRPFSIGFGFSVGFDEFDFSFFKTGSNEKRGCQKYTTYCFQSIVCRVYISLGLGLRLGLGFRVRISIGLRFILDLLLPFI